MAGAREPATGAIISGQGPLAGGLGYRILYVNKVGRDGWVNARSTTSSALVPLCMYTRVMLYDRRQGRTSFKVMDGPSKGQLLSMADANAGEYLGSKAPTASPVKLKVTYGAYTPGWVSQARGGQQLDQQLATLEVGSLSVEVTMNSVWGTGYTPLPPGDYKVLLPDAPHRGGMTRFYASVAPDLKYDQVWFPIKYGDNSRYVHVGNLSDGCVTVLDIDRWADIHDALISHRDPDGVSVGDLSVTGKPGRER